MLESTQLVLLITFGFFLLYLALLSVLASAARRTIIFEPSRFRRFAVIVPAHNEELTIGKTLRSLFEIDYPCQYFDVLVVADNCTDRTAEVASSLGATVHKRENLSLQGKGYALRWTFDLLLDKAPEYDALVIVDADSVVSKNFLTVMNFYLGRGAKAIQSADMVEQQPGAWSSEVTRVAFALYNYVRPLGRRVIGCSAGLRGNGMCFAADTLRSIPWQSYSLAEDLEYGLELLLGGATVLFAPEASVLARMPRNPRIAETQRARWETGRFPLIREYAGRLLGSAFKHGSFKAFDAFIDLITPPIVNILVAVISLLSLSLLLWGIGIDESPRFVILWLTLIGIGVAHVLIGLYAARADRLMYKALLHIPRYALWKLGLYAKLLLLGQTHEWIRTKREHPIAHSVPDKSVKQ